MLFPLSDFFLHGTCPTLIENLPVRAPCRERFEERILSSLLEVSLPARQLGVFSAAT
jgi:hypothetical protein